MIGSVGTGAAGWRQPGRLTSGARIVGGADVCIRYVSANALVRPLSGREEELQQTQPHARLAGQSRSRRMHRPLVTARSDVRRATGRPSVMRPAAQRAGRRDTTTGGEFQTISDTLDPDAECLAVN
jgi:hypothetical protein